MSKKNWKKKFNQIWSNQTNLGKKFNISSIAVGKLLIEAGLKDPDTKLATKKALDEGFAKSTPLKDGTPYFMWNVDKVRPVISEKYKPLDAIDYWVNEVKRIYREAQKLSDEGEDKMGYMLADTAYDDVPQSIKELVRKKVEEQNKVD